MLAHRATDIKTESHVPWHAQQAMIQYTHPLHNNSHLLLKILPLCEKPLNKTIFSLILMEKIRTYGILTNDNQFAQIEWYISWTVKASFYK